MTYSIVARDHQTGELGVAVQSHWFSVGAVVSWARPGVGAVATQANALAGHGPRVLDLIASGMTAAAAVAASLAEDEFAITRQLAAVDANGTVGAHTGAECMAFSGDISGNGVSCQANIMRNESVWGAMLDAFNNSSGELAERLLAALRAAEAAGGDIRGKQSASILVVPAEGEPWETTVSLRVDDHPEPLDEIGRLLDLHRAYQLAGQGDECAGAGRYDEAAALYQRSSELAPGNHELLFWSGLGKVQSGDVEGGMSEVRTAIAMHPEWEVLLPRLDAKIAPAATVVREQLGLDR